MTSENYALSKGVPVTLLASFTHSAMATTVKLIGGEASDSVIVCIQEVRNF